ncbi:uncharacterized protein LOC130010499 [Patella vulgata]|uniref:uncharacterized protein LOC130010499 n=1 Tax=Patella vulgata TaxID=6465 RepID=UPI0024A9ECDD|nr:uncharacterized protein LOC130010499 [Patella vulgata]
MEVYHFLIVLLASCYGFPDFPFYNVSLTWKERVDDLVGRLTLPEMIGQMAKGKGGTDAIPRLDIKPFEWWTECLRGDVQQGGTGFPEAIGLAAAFSPEVIYDVSRATGIEIRAKNTMFSKAGNFNVGTGLSCCSPVINIMRDPRWGRNEETYGEDPFFTGVYAEAFVRGLQGEHPRYVLASTGCKHFDTYTGPEDIPVSRFGFNAEVSMRDLRTTFLPAFRTCVNAGTYSIMCSYSSVNGVPSCASKELLTDILRDEWGYEGLVISDNVALEYMITAHHYVNNSLDAAVASLEAGCNIEISSSKSKVYDHIGEAVSSGRVSETRVRELMKPVMYNRMRLGEFDPPEMNPYTNLDMSVIQSPEHRQIALQTAMKTMVLLKNLNNFLPTRVGIFHKIAIVGPAANDPHVQTGGYSPAVDPRYTTTPLMNLSRLGNTVQYSNGCNGNTTCIDYDQAGIIKAVQGVDLVIVCLGLGNAVEKEFYDRPNIALPGKQLELLQDSVNNSPANTPVLLIMFNAGPVDITWADSNPRVVAILEAFYPSQATGEALFNVLTMNGPNSAPAGRLPCTWPMNENQIPPMVNYSMEGRTYRYINYDPLYPYGYGLSYTSFTYSNLQFSQSILAGNDVEGSVDVYNNGQISADEVIQVYINWQNSPVPTPKLQLVDFKRQYIIAQNKIRVTFRVKGENMAVWMEDNSGWMVYPGQYGLFVGGQQPNQKKTADSNVLSGTFTVTKTRFLGKY